MEPSLTASAASVLLASFASQMQASYQEDCLSFGNARGCFALQAHEVTEGFSILLGIFHTHKRLNVALKPMDGREVFALGYFLCEDRNADLIWEENSIGLPINLNHAFLKLPSFDGMISLPAQASIRFCSILMDKEWIQKNMSYTEETPDLIDRLIQSHRHNFIFQAITTDEQAHLNQVFTLRTQRILSKLALNAGAYCLVTRFFHYLSLRDQQISFSEINGNDIRQVILVHQQLVQNLQHQAPHIEHLSKQAGMSESKLKRLFKGMYGSSIYAYHQHKRLELAKELIQSGQKTVSEAGYFIGYNNLSKFSEQFRAYFGFLPSHYKPTRAKG